MKPMDKSEPAAGFETEPRLDVFALWEPAPEAVMTPGDMEEAFSFGLAGQSPTPTVSTWRLKLPADLETAVTQLAGAETQMQASETALAALPQRLDQLLQQGQTALAPGLSFSAAVEEAGLAQPEAELLQVLAELQDGGQPELSFAVGEAPGNWQRANEHLQAVLQRLLGLVTYLARVETQIEDQFVGCTIVGWTGSMRTAWGTGFGPDHLALHRRSLALALASRQTLLRTLMIATQGAAKISALLAIPGGQILALPVAWKYVNQVLAEVDQYHEIKAKGA
jgi:hypothetical protein